MAAKYADEIAARFSKGDDSSADDSEDAPDDTAGDAALGRRYLRAVKSGDALAVVEAIRAICA